MRCEGEAFRRVVVFLFAFVEVLVRCVGDIFDAPVVGFVAAAFIDVLSSVAFGVGVVGW